MKKKKISLFILVSFWIQAKAQFNYNVVEVAHFDNAITSYYVPDEQIASERWDVLAQPNFWRKVMSLSPDSCIINVAETRQILQYASFTEWQNQTEEEKDSVRHYIRWINGLDSNTSLYVTSGKNHFYNFEGVIPSLSKGIEIFEEQGVNPWYAQTILLIESPGKVQYSNVGAYGPFQLMKSVAKTYGLTVNKEVDERKDFDKSAEGASKLLKYSCIPNAKKILDRNNISYNEDDLWFKLFVLHIYHAGAGNVGGLIDEMKPEYGGINLITDMWQTEHGGFKNASQNYSQVALASNIILEEMIYNKCEYTYPCSPTLSHVLESID